MLSNPRNHGEPVAQRQAPHYPMDPRLIDATGAAIARWGLARTTLNRIAAEADMARATFYRRGVSRSELISAFTDKAVERFRAALSPALTRTGNAADRLHAALEAMCATADEHLLLLAGIFLAQDEILDRPKLVILMADVFTEPLEQLLRDGGADGSLGEVQPAVTATMLFNTVCCGYLRLRAAHGWDPETARQSVLGFVLHGLVVS